jgi:hypothetical protein
MRKDYFIILGIVFLFVGCALAFASVLTIGINDGEWGRIARAGTISKPEELTWSVWQTNDGSVTRFEEFRSAEEFGLIIKYRIGQAHGFLFNFTAYEGQCIQSNNVVTVPAIGPNWGASYHRQWTFVAFGVGAILIISSIFLPRRKSPA